MKLELRFTLPNQVSQVVALQGSRVLIGTLLSNQVVIRAAGVDPIHAMLELEGTNDPLLTDLGSRTGVKVNQKLIEVETPLKVGDIIQIGAIDLELREVKPIANVLPLSGARQPEAKTREVPPTPISQGTISAPPPPSRAPTDQKPLTQPAEAKAPEPGPKVGSQTIKSPSLESDEEERGDPLFSPRQAKPQGNVLEVVSYWDDTVLDVDLFHPRLKGYHQVVIGDDVKAHFLAGGNEPLPLHLFVEFKGEGYRVRQVAEMVGRYRKGGKVESLEGKGSKEMGRRDVTHIRYGAISYFIAYVQPPPLDLPRERIRDPLFFWMLSVASLLYLMAAPYLLMTKPKPKELDKEDIWTLVNTPTKLEKPKDPPKPDLPKPPPPKPEQKVVEKKEVPPPKPPPPPPPPPKPVEPPVAKEKPQQTKPVEKVAEKPAEKPAQAAVKPLAPQPPKAPTPVAPAAKPAASKEGMAAANSSAKADFKKPGPVTKSNELKTGGAKGSGNEQRGGERKGNQATSVAGVEGPKNDKPSGVNLSKLGLGAGKILDKTGPGAIATNMKSSAGGAGGGSGSGAKTRGLGGIGGSGSLGLAGAAGELNNFGSGSGGNGSGQGGLGGLGGNGIGSGFGDRGNGAGGKGRASVEVPPGDPVVEGGLSQQEVQAVIRANLNQIRHCYEQLLQRSPSASGKVKVRFMVGTNGRVSSAEIVSTSINDSVMQGCISGAVQRWAFPQPRGGQPVTVTYPFVFNPS